MAGGKLDILLRLRRLTVQDRMRELAVAIRTEEQARRAQAAAVQTIARETAAARHIAERDAALAGFVPWHTRAAAALRDAKAQVTRAGEAMRTAQAVLSDARGAMRAIELALERRKVGAKLAAQRSVQHALDDASRRSGCAAHRSGEPDR
jgi:hypothetical protein